MAVFLVILCLIFSHSLPSPAKSCTYQPPWEYGFALVDHSYKSFIADRLASCYIACNMQPACQSLNYNLADKTCEFNNDTKYFRPKYFVEKPTFVYGTNPESGKLIFCLQYQISPSSLCTSFSLLLSCKQNELATSSNNQ